MSAAKHTPGPYINGTPLHSIPPGRWFVYAKGDVLVGTLMHTANENVDGWRFFPADQGLPSRRYWPSAPQAIPRRFGHTDALFAIDAAKATGSAA